MINLLITRKPMQGLTNCRANNAFVFTPDIKQKLLAKHFKQTVRESCDEPAASRKAR